MTTFRPDLLIENSDGDPIALVEVEAMSNLTRDEAIEIRRNIVARSLPAHIPYFLLLSQDVGFLWKVHYDCKCGNEFCGRSRT